MSSSRIGLLLRLKVKPSILLVGQHARPLNSPPAGSNGSRRVVGWWLLGCCGLVAGSVILGGVTRLTESGLSMTKWHLVKGMRPPTTYQQWQEEFQRYQQFPEYQYVHKDLTLEEFKWIFYMEYAHRMWGRMIGLAVILPAVGFWAKGWFGPALKRRSVLYSGLVVAQGLLGWWMVKSGLEAKPEVTDIPRVSQYRLAAHLSMALLLYSSMLYTALGLLAPPSTISKGVSRLRHAAHGATALIFVTALSGAFVAGLDAGLVYNSFPKMGGQWIPEEWLQLRPKIKNFFENPTTVQLDHRILGMSTLSFVLGCWALARGVGVPRRARLAANCMAAMSITQVSLLHSWL